MAEAERKAARRHAKKNNGKERRPIKPWQDTSVNELRAFFGIYIYMQDHIERREENYWSTKPDDPRYDLIRATMVKDRFLQLNRYFHVHDTMKDNMMLFDKLKEVSNHI